LLRANLGDNVRELVANWCRRSTNMLFTTTFTRAPSTWTATADLILDKLQRPLARAESDRFYKWARFTNTTQKPRASMT
jgi:hypothetical protein